MSTAKQIDGQRLGSGAAQKTTQLLHLVGHDRTPILPELEEHDAAAATLAPVAVLESREKTYRRFLGLADGIACIAALLIAGAVSGRTLTWGIVFVPAFAVLVAKITGLYERDDQVVLKGNVAEWRSVLQTATITSMGMYMGWRVLTDAPRGGGMRLFVLLVLASFALAVTLRFIARRLARRLCADERCVIVGDPRGQVGLAQRLEAAPGVDVVGILPEQSLTGSVAQLSAVVEELALHRLVIAPAAEPTDSTLHLIQAAKFIGVRVSLVPSVMTAVGGFAVIEELDGLTLLGVPRFGLSRSSMLIKRLFDLSVAATALIFLGPILVVIGLAIKLDSPGPVLFRQTRMGRGGKPFRILKFRSMVDGADSMKAGLLGHNEAGDGLFKIAADPRITRVGRHMRSTHLDELPQLINVLTGEMSLVGPRPLVVEEDARLKGRDRHRIHLTPGITGPWQVRGPMNTPLSEMAKLDYRYASSWSIWQDIDILLRTAVHMMDRGGH